jgi:alpha-glucosidase (family GH31 glycosyl hydrolase)
MKNILNIVLLISICGIMKLSAQETIKLPLEKGELWWGGLSADGHLMPYSESSNVKRDLYGQNYGNQAQPLLVSNKGRYVWSENPISYSFENGVLEVNTRTGKLDTGNGGENLYEVFRYCKQKYFPPQGKYPEELMFTAPQYNTWIELMYDQNEKDILAYAQKIIDLGYPPGVLMIDDNWQEDYGVWEFSRKRFSDPKGMIKKLQQMGFKVMLWVCPFISPDSETFRYLSDNDLLLVNADSKNSQLWGGTYVRSAMIQWWNGVSAVLDLGNPKSQVWFKKQLYHLVDEYGVDGFKFDAGDASFYDGNFVSYKPGSPNDHTMYFAEVGLDYPLNEYRSSWKMAGYPLAQRLKDKNHKWEDLQKLIPDIISQGILGYAFTCPDMIGGGEYRSFLSSSTIDEELVIRSAQVHALMPMMQFSVAPWRVLSDEGEALCRKMALLHSEMGDEIMKWVKKSAQTGEPIVRAMEYQYPNQGFERVTDQFMLGNGILVAPVVEKGQRQRAVVLPAGIWQAEDGNKYKGNQTITIDCPLERLPWFRKIDAK